MDVIGSRVFVDLENITHVPAKIDTGAYTSSVWATNIREERGGLAFELFAPESEFYNGQTLWTADFSRVPVTSSNGQTELRYKVFLKLKLGGREIRARFTLANRSGLTFPILIGRRTLRRKFLVDVSKSDVKRSQLREVGAVLSEKGEK